MQPVQVRQTFPQSVIELGLEADVVIEIVPRAERWTMAQANILEESVRVGIYVLIAQERPDASKAL